MGRRALIAASGLAFLASGAVADAKIEYLKSKAKPVKASKQESQKLACPSGMHVLSGGVYTTGGSLEDEVAGSAPFDGADRDKQADDGWRGAINAGATDEKMRTYAICSNTLRTTYRQAKFDYAPTGLITGTEPECPGSSEPVGGGVTVPGNSTQVPIVVSYPDAGGWGSGLISYAGDGKATAHAICSGEPGIANTSASESTSANTQNRIDVSCPDGSSAIGGGGVFVPDSDDDVELATLNPSDGIDDDEKPDDGWTTWFNNQTSSSADTVTFVVCLG